MGRAKSRWTNSAGFWAFPGSRFIPRWNCRSIWAATMRCSPVQERRPAMSPDPLEIMLRGFRLPTMALTYARTLEQAEQQNWGYRKFLQHLCESEAQDRQERRVARLLKRSGLPD